MTPRNTKMCRFCLGGPKGSMCEENRLQVKFVPYSLCTIHAVPIVFERNKCVSSTLYLTPAPSLE